MSILSTNMEKWVTISGRFTQEEADTIEEYRDKINLSDNQLVRQGVQLMVGIKIMEDLFNKPDMTFFKSFIEEWKDMMKTPEMEQRMEEMLEKTALRYKEKQLNDFVKKTNQFTKDLKIFDKKRKRGRISKFEKK